MSFLCPPTRYAFKAALAAALLSSAACEDVELPSAVSGSGTPGIQLSVGADDAAFASVSAGDLHSCGVTTAGAAYCWGDNTSGQLGDGTNISSNVPVAVTGGHTFTSVSAGAAQSCGVTTAGAAYCWGGNDSGQLGNGANTDNNVPVAVSGAHVFASISAGTSHRCGMTTAGAAYCWGGNGSGQLGDGTTANSNVPAAVSGGHSFASMSAGLFHSCGITTAGAAYCWGLNSRGQLGNGTKKKSPTNAPVAVSGDQIFASVSTGGYHSCGVTTAGAAYCWGYNFYGQLGNAANAGDITVPVAVSGSLTFSATSAGDNHTCGMTTVDTTYCWGYNFYGQLGNGTNTDSNVPVAVSSGGHTFVSAPAGLYHSCGVTTEAKAACWGRNSDGQLGNGMRTDSNVPRKVGRNPG